MRARPILPLALLCAAACAPDFKKRSEIFDDRILALVAVPLAAGPGEVVTVTPWAVKADGTPFEGGTWSFCPFSLGSVVGYACAVPACERDLPAAPDGSVALEPYAELLACAAKLAAGGESPPVGAGGVLPESVEVLFRYRLGDDADARKAVLRFPVYRDPVPWQGDPSRRNAPPEFAHSTDPISVRGTWARGGKVEVCAPLTAASAQQYLGASGEVLRESPVVSFYSTAGVFDFDRATAESDYCAKLEAKDVPLAVTAARLWAVGRDLRGGQVVAGPVVLPLGQ